MSNGSIAAGFAPAGEKSVRSVAAVEEDSSSEARHDRSRAACARAMSDGGAVMHASVSLTGVLFTPVVVPDGVDTPVRRRDALVGVGIRTRPGPSDAGGPSEPFA
jgi:hypothetical protein